MNPPAWVIRIPLEGAPQVLPDWLDEAEGVRLDLWLSEAHPEYGELVARAIELAREARAA